MVSRCLRSLVVLLVASAALVGCRDDDGTTGPSGGQIGGVHDAGRCDEEKRAIGAGDSSPLGFTAAEVLSSTSGARSAALTWAKGGTTRVTVTLGASTAVRFVHATPASDDDMLQAEAECGDYLEIDAPLDFETADGAFAESLPVTLRATGPDAADVDHELDLAALNGSYRLTEVDPSQFKEVKVFLRATLDGTGVTGAVEGSAERLPSGSGDDASVGLQSFPVAAF